MNDEHLFEAYRTSRYEVRAPSGAIVLRHCERSAQLDALLDPARPEWAFVTAWNPASRPLSAAENERRQQGLLAELRGRFQTLPGRGAGEGWEPEESVLVLGIPKDEAILLGRRFGQLAIVVGRRGEPAQVVRCAE